MITELERYCRGQAPDNWKVKCPDGRIFQHGDRVWVKSGSREAFIDLRELDSHKVMVRYARLEHPHRGGTWARPGDLWTQAEFELVQNTKGI